MTDLTVEDLIICFSFKQRLRLQKVGDTGDSSWVQDHAGNIFQASFADNCVRLTLADDFNRVFHADFLDILESVSVSGNLLDIKSE